MLNWEQVTNCPNTFVSAVAADSNSTFQGFRTMTPYRSKGDDAIVMQATVLVTWTNRHRRPVTNQLATLLAKDGLNKTTL